MNQQQTWITAAHLEAMPSARGVLIVLFWSWGIVGLFANGILFLALSGSVGLGMPADITATVLLWIGGMVLFGVGGAAVPVSYEFKRLDTPQPEPGASPSEDLH